jgi:hypothetical protein
VRVYGDLRSGNCLKVKWTADALGIDIMKGESRTPGYLAKFPQGQVPAVEFAGGSTLAQSNAIITVADIALLAYTRLAHEGGFDLGRWPERAPLGRALRSSARARAGIGIADREPVYGQAVVHVLGVQDHAAGQQRSRNDHRIIHVELMPLGEQQSALVCLER